MLHATELLGSEAYDAQGNFVGRVKEFYLEPAEQGNRVSRVLLTRGKYQPLLARHDQIGFVAPGTMRLTVEEKDLEHYRPNESWLAVRKDLLDQQIIDTHGRKVVRVNDVDLTEQRVNGNVELRVTRVDVGLTGAVGRLLQGVASPSLIRRIQDKLPPRMIPWEFVNLIEPDPLRRVKLRLTSSKLAHMHPADLAELMEELSPDERSSVIATLDEAAAAEVIAELDKRLKTQLVETLEPGRAADILEEMPPDEAADLLADLPPERSRELLEEMPKREAEEVKGLLQFEGHTAGGMMTTEVVQVGEDATRGEVVDYIRFHDVPLDQLDTVILIDTKAVFVGTVSVTRLMLAEKDQRMAALVSDPLVSVGPQTDEREVFELFDKYNLRSLTVVNAEQQPIGAITVDDIVSRLHAQLK
ncbi:MAG: CBS domain-containing protein [Candidatus Acidiferrales bacterium]|jgi:sporulation protein YlmC with PRC-barrel domain/CBS domain-containing protein